MVEQDKGMGFLSSSWTDPPSPRPPRWVLWLARPHKVSNKRCVSSGVTKSGQRKAGDPSPKAQQARVHNTTSPKYSTT